MDFLKNNELRALPIEQLELTISGWRHKLLEIRLSAATKHIKTLSSDMRRLKKMIARGLTLAREKQLGNING